MTPTQFVMIATILAGLTLHGPLGFAQETKKVEMPKAEAKSEESKAATPAVEFEAEKLAAQKRAQLLKDAQVALEETRKALEALDQGNKEEALAALEKVTGKLALIVARDPALKLAPVATTTIVRDLYANPETVKAAVKLAKEALGDGKVQDARALLAGLASEVEVRVENIPLATYPEAIKAIAPLIDAGMINEAKTALTAALNTLVVENFVIPIPKIRAKSILAEAEKLAEKKDRSTDENKKLHDLVEAARLELQLGEALGYGTKEDYKPLYTELDEIQKKTADGKSGQGFFDKINNWLKS
jgi:hypothetical protein